MIIQVLIVCGTGQNDLVVRVGESTVQTAAAEIFRPLKPSAEPGQADYRLSDRVKRMMIENDMLQESLRQNNRWGIRLGAVEKDMLARITMLESGGECDEGQQAVVEVIFNRMYSDEFPDTLYGVLSQELNGIAQFSTWKNRYQKAAVPTRRVKQNIEKALSGGTGILPYETVYFSQKGENKNVQCVIGNHVFCNQ